MNSLLKNYLDVNVLKAAKDRIEYVFENFEKIYLSFSGGKDSTVMFHLIMDEAIKRNKKVGVLLVDLEAQYNRTIKHCENMFKVYKDNIDLYWVCLPISLRNSVSNFQPKWTCWDKKAKDLWVRDISKQSINNLYYFPFFKKGMEFEEFVNLFGIWYGNGKRTANFIGIRCDESLNRFRAISSKDKNVFRKRRYITKIEENLFSVYPIYDWKFSDIWKYHGIEPNKNYNKIYDLMYMAGLAYSKMRLCQPYGDDQKRGLWLYHILEPETWYKVVNRVNGVNSGSLYANENGNFNGNIKISKPKEHTWKSFCELLIHSLPINTKNHYNNKFCIFIEKWKKMGYADGISDEVPLILENKLLAPSWRMLCKVILRNDYWCKSLGMSQPKSKAYGDYLKIRDANKNNSLQ